MDGIARWFVVAAVTLCGCSAQPPVREATSAGAVAEVPRETSASRPRIVILGDSLTAGYGLPSEQAFPSVLQHTLDEAGYPFEIVNAGVSGDTTAGGLRRLDWALDGDVRVLVVALGGNDGLRGLSVEDMSANLDAIIAQAHDRGIAVVLCGMEAPPNFGPEYTARFREAFGDLAARRGTVRFVPFLLDGVAGVPSLNQSDGIHPNADGARRVANLVWRSLEPLIAPLAAP